MKNVLFILLLLSIGLESASQHSVSRLPYPVNTTKYDEICPVFNYEESTMYFTRVGDPQFNKVLFYNGEDLSESDNMEIYFNKLSEIYTKVTGNFEVDPIVSDFNQDIWVARMKDKNYIVSHPGYPLNDALPNSICSKYGKEGEFITINQFFEKGGMQAGFSVVNISKDDNSTFPRPFTIRGFNKSGSEVNLSMSIDKRVIILSMINEDGNKDLYFSGIIYDTLYSTPSKLKIINTPYNETTPFLSRNKTKLYFASDRPGGNGGLDLYVCERLDGTYRNWSEPKTFNPFVNSTANESHPYVSKDEKKIFFTSDRGQSSDIYEGYLERDDISNHITIKINVIKEGNEKNFPADIYWKETFDNKGETEKFWRSNDGYHEMIIDKNTPFDFWAKNRNYESKLITIDPQYLIQDKINEYHLELVLAKDGSFTIKKVEEESDKPDISINIDLAEGALSRLSNIYFKRAKADVLPESFPTLKALADIIKRNPTLVIQIEGHTDNVGDEQALIALSLSRANAIKSYLKSQNVPEYQLQIMGYGAKKPLNDNSTEALRRQNRRVEIRIIKT